MSSETGIKESANEGKDSSGFCSPERQIEWIISTMMMRMTGSLTFPYPERSAEEEEEDDWIFDVALPGEKRGREEEEEDGDDVGEMSGGRLFEFDLQQGEMPRRWRNIVHKTRHKATLRQTREARDGDHLGNAMSEAVRLALVSIVSNHPNLKDDDAIHFTMQSNAFAQRTNHCFQSCQFRVEEIGDDEDDSSVRFDAYMDQLAKQLNSSQSFSPGDDFSLEVTTIRLPEEGGRGKSMTRSSPR